MRSLSIMNSFFKVHPWYLSSANMALKMCPANAQIWTEEACMCKGCWNRINYKEEAYLSLGLQSYPSRQVWPKYCHRSLIGLSCPWTWEGKLSLTLAHTLPILTGKTNNIGFLQLPSTRIHRDCLWASGSPQVACSMHLDQRRPVDKLCHLKRHLLACPGLAFASTA